MQPSHFAELVDADAVAAHFRVSVEAVRRWARDGRIPSFRANQRIVRFRLSDVERALAVEVRAGRE
jgi:predicted site-specific integrase-resolvase